MNHKKRKERKMFSRFQPCRKRKATQKQGYGTERKDVNREFSVSGLVCIRGLPTARLGGKQVMFGTYKTE